MQFVNRIKLQTSMLEQGIKIKDLSEELCITYSGAYAKVKGTRDFNENELVVLNRMFGSDVFFLDSLGRKTKQYGRNRKKNRTI